MDIKLFEIRDRATFIPAMAVRLRNRTPSEFLLLRRAGYGADEIGGPEESLGALANGREPYVILVKLEDVAAEYDSFAWQNQRTMGTAHRHILSHWAELTTGDVIDVEHILGETEAPKASEAIA